MLGEALGADGFALAGGAALYAHGVSERPTDDLDSFSAICQDFQAAFDKATAALAGAGFDVRVDRRSETFCRLVVSQHRALRQPFRVDLGIDSILWGIEASPFGPALSTRELAANKILAAFGRNEPRDLCDLERLSGRSTTWRMLADAKEKDPGFDAEILCEMISRTLSRPHAEWPTEDLSAVRAFCDRLMTDAGTFAKRHRSPDGLEALGPLASPSNFTEPYRRKDGTPVRGYYRRPSG